ncbi:hypothetical protein [Amycolatopsis sp. DG1A-15b]|uniref:hypothetical protein n=1 Tax=Amycolatopsis sp. DG1A-15b TaxID=3052846 RepID=UPI00255B97B6|nr:hypothetical protein [Amycolatopsis sp. DG1A-15b]WIX84690.1 hypothetical protein QRY02_25910 [Amycolatopsis sp. DG1A-15b]
MTLEPPDLPKDSQNGMDRRQSLGEFLREKRKMSERETEYIKIEVTRHSEREKICTRKAVAAVIAGTLALTGGGVYLVGTIGKGDSTPTQPGVAPSSTPSPAGPPTSSTPVDPAKKGPGSVECSTVPPVADGPSAPTTTSSAAPPAKVRTTPESSTRPEMKPGSPGTPPATSDPKPTATVSPVSPDPDPDPGTSGLVGVAKEIVTWPLRVLGLHD